MFDLSLPKLLILAVIALVVFGPNGVPKMAAKAGKALRELRKIADGAKTDLREGLGRSSPSSTSTTSTRAGSSRSTCSAT